MVDLLVANARVVDGTGAPWFRGTVGVERGEIAWVRRDPDPDASAETRIDADGDVVCPGFVDMHSHSDLELFADPTLEPKVRQGVTTEVLGQDGFSMAPLHDGDPDAWQTRLSGLAGSVDVDWTWGSLGGYLDAVEAHGVAPNVATCVGLGTVRYDVLGMADRDPTDEELAAMGDRVTEALDDGAVALSMGLAYPPQNNAGTAEVRAMAERLAPFGRPFVAHIRNQRRRLWTALDEFVEIGAAAGVPLHLSHVKLPGPLQRGKAERMVARLAAARERGVDITADQYPYTAGSTTLANLLPPWAQAGGPDATLERLDDPEARERIRRDVTEWRIDDWENLGRYTGWENIVITNVGGEADDDVVGRSVAAIARDRDEDPVTVVCDVLLASELAASMLIHQLDEDDVRDILTAPGVCIGTDGLFGGQPHPRVYGTYPKILGRYVRQENLLSLEAAVRKMTSLPARAMGLDAKGLVRPGMDADLVVFDPLTVDSPATYDDPRRYPTGISHVAVNGDLVVRDGAVTGETPGRAVRA